jgi:predicted transposase YbfD/YdcC
MQRQAATVKGIKRRLVDLRLEAISDPRKSSQVDHPLAKLMAAAIGAICSGANTLRDFEIRSEQLADLGWGAGRIADNTFSPLLNRLSPQQCGQALQRMVKREHRRGNLKPLEHISQNVVAIDGKHVATLRWHDLCRLVQLDQHQATEQQVREKLTDIFPQVQFHKGTTTTSATGLVRVHTATLVSAQATVPMLVENIPGRTNEIGALPQTLETLDKAYGKTAMIDMITTDAGNTSEATARIIDAKGWEYFCQLKENHGEIYNEASRQLASLSEQNSHAQYDDRREGHRVSYDAWAYDLGDSGWLQWTHARQLIRIRRVVDDIGTGHRISEGNRFYVTNQKPRKLSSKRAMMISRAHWRCENGTHWTADTQLGEDLRRPVLSRHPIGILNTVILRLIALAIISVARALSRIAGRKEPPTWKMVRDNFLVALCLPVLECSAFAVD